MAHRQEDESTKADHAQKLKDLQNKHTKVTKEANDKHVQETQDQIYKFAEMKAALAADQEKLRVEKDARIQELTTQMQTVKA